MIRSVYIDNFRCYDRARIDDLSQINIIVGDNGAGKTSLLEALFLTLSGSVEVSLRLRQQRGFDATFGGTGQSFEEAMWRDYFYDGNWDNSILIALDGTGEDARMLTVSRTVNELSLPISGGQGQRTSPVTFTWTDAAKRQHLVQPSLMGQMVNFPASGEILPDFYLFPANAPISSTEAAVKFSALSLEGNEGRVVDIFRKEFPFIRGLSVEAVGGSPIIHASIEGSKRKRPLNSVSGGINRTMMIMLALATTENGVVLVDEAENGIFHRHKVPIWKGILNLARSRKTQLFITTHDEEWLSALIEATPDNVGDISVLRLETDYKKQEKNIRHFTGRALEASVKFGGDIR